MASSPESGVEEIVQPATPLPETSPARFSAEFNGVNYTEPSDLELAISLEFLSCIQTDQIIPNQRICDVLVPAFLHYLSKGNSIASKFIDSNVDGKQNKTAEMYALFFKIQDDIDAAKKNFERLKEWEKTLDDHIKKLLVHDWDWKDKFTEKPADDAGDLSAHSSQLYEKLRQIDETVTSLRRHIEQPPYAVTIKRSDDVGQSSSSNTSRAEEESSHQSFNAEHSEIVASNDFQARYGSLSHHLQKCLLYFSAFPPNSKIRNKALTYLWIGEGFTDDDNLSSEEVAATYFEKLVSNGFIEPVDEKDTGDFSSCRMNPSIHSAVVQRAKEIDFFDFDGKDKPTTNYITSRKACLSRTGDGSLERLIEDVGESDADKLYTLFNLDETFPEFPAGWLSKMKNLMTLCLGSWRSLDKSSFLVENADFLQDLHDLKLLKCLSLNRIYKIRKLPSSICKLPNLKILDLKACYDLQEIPDAIGSLENLTHLDMSECHLIDYMPKGLSRLAKLLVLKGFVISADPTTQDQCSLADLAKLEKLKKLSIYINRSITGNEGQFNCLFQFKALQVLTISWIRAPSRAPSRPPLHKLLSSKTFKSKKHDQPVEVPIASSLPASLQKLDLKCWPLQAMPRWANPLQLHKLKKLYIRGGSLNDLRQEMYHPDQWTVKILRLQYLKELEMNWQTTHQLFPELVYLHKIDCPKLVSFPADGEWRPDNKRST